MSVRNYNTQNRYRRRRAEAEFSPVEVSGLVLWLKADAISGIADAGAVSTWPDSSPNGNDAIQGTGSKQPILKVNIINGKPVVRPDATDDIMALPTDLLADVDVYTMFFVVQYSVWETAHNVIMLGDGNTTLQIYNANTEGGWRCRTEASYPRSKEYSGAVTANTPYILTLERDASGQSLRSNGVSLSGGAQSTGTVTDWAIMGQTGGTTTGYDWAEFLIYQPEISTADRDKIETYLNNKYKVF
jgi:hypothetical protein